MNTTRRKDKRKKMDITRRTVFKGLAAASSLPLFNIGCAGFGASRARQIAKGSKIRVALIGCGLQTKAMIDGVLCENLVAIVDPDPARFAWLDKYVADTCGAAERENYAKARRFATYQDMFDKMGGEIDAIVVETPNHQHVLRCWRWRRPTASRTIPSTRTASYSSARRAASGSRITADTASCRGRTGGAFRASTGRTTSTTALSRRSTSTSSTTRSARAYRL